MDDSERLRLAVNTARNRITWNKGHDAGMPFGAGLAIIGLGVVSMLGLTLDGWQLVWTGVGVFAIGLIRYYSAKTSGWIL